MKILKKILFAIIFIVIIVGAIIFATENRTDVTINYLFGTVTTDLSFVVIGAVIVGILIGLLGCFFLWTSLRWHKSKANKKLKQVQQEVKQLKARSSAA